jgi:hypothetical protein
LRLGNPYSNPALDLRDPDINPTKKVRALIRNIGYHHLPGTNKNNSLHQFLILYIMEHHLCYSRGAERRSLDCIFMAHF